MVTHYLARRNIILELVIKKSLFVINLCGSVIDFFFGYLALSDDRSLAGLR
jgi:hypothetical protein